jgi:hypothetical protein
VALDGNLVFSQASYIPRSTSVNLTVDLFGESINVFEVRYLCMVNKKRRNVTKYINNAPLMIIEK